MMISLIFIQLLCVHYIAFGYPIYQTNKTVEIDGEEYDTFQGDILIRKEKFPFRTIKLNTRKWDNGLMPYTIDGSYTDYEKATIRRAMDRVEKTTGSCLKFVQRTNQVSYIAIRPTGRGCYSLLGQDYKNQEQQLSLDKKCIGVGTIMHELLHAAGFVHEHSRPDRDFYVQVNYGNLLQGSESDFEVYKTTDVNSFNQPYDYYSIMHYSSNAFSKNGQPTIQSRKSGIDMAKVGNGQYLSDTDVVKIKAYYGCPAGSVNPIVPTSFKPLDVSVLDAQCKSRFDSPTASFCRWSVYDKNVDLCSELWCRTSNNNPLSCTFSSGKWVEDGTPCGVGKSCYQDKCVPNGNALQSCYIGEDVVTSNEFSGTVQLPSTTLTCAAAVNHLNANGYDPVFYCQDESFQFGRTCCNACKPYLNEKCVDTIFDCKRNKNFCNGGSFGAPINKPVRDVCPFTCGKCTRSSG